MNCQNCEAEITFMTALKQPTPYRFKCSECKTRHKVSTPRMGIILIGIVILFATLTLFLIIGGEELGTVFEAPFLIFILGLWVVVEVFMHKYMSKNSVLTRIDEPATENTNNNQG